MHSEVQRLFLELADLSVAERAVYFDRHPVDPRLRTEVESLLRYDSGEKGDSITGVIHAVQERFTGSLCRTILRTLQAHSIVGPRRHGLRLSGTTNGR